MNNHLWRIGAARWVRFNLVGASGLGVQLATLLLLTTALQLPAHGPARSARRSSSQCQQRQ